MLVPLLTKPSSSYKNRVYPRKGGGGGGSGGGSRGGGGGKGKFYYLKVKMEN